MEVKAWECPVCRTADVLRLGAKISWGSDVTLYGVVCKCGRKPVEFFSGESRAIELWNEWVEHRGCDQIQDASEGS